MSILPSFSIPTQFFKHVLTHTMPQLSLPVFLLWATALRVLAASPPSVISLELRLDGLEASGLLTVSQSLCSPQSGLAGAPLGAPGPGNTTHVSSTSDRDSTPTPTPTAEADGSSPEQSFPLPSGVATSAPFPIPTLNATNNTRPSFLPASRIFTSGGARGARLARLIH